MMASPPATSARILAVKNMAVQLRVLRAWQDFVAASKLRSLEQRRSAAAAALGRSVTLHRALRRWRAVVTRNLLGCAIRAGHDAAVRRSVWSAWKLALRMAVLRDATRLQAGLRGRLAAFTRWHRWARRRHWLRDAQTHWRAMVTRRVWAAFSQGVQVARCAQRTVLRRCFHGWCVAAAQLRVWRLAVLRHSVTLWRHCVAIQRRSRLTTLRRSLRIWRTHVCAQATTRLQRCMALWVDAARLRAAQRRLEHQATACGNRRLVARVMHVWAEHTVHSAARRRWAAVCGDCRVLAWALRGLRTNTRRQRVQRHAEERARAALALAAWRSLTTCRRSSRQLQAAVDLRFMRRLAGKTLRGWHTAAAQRVRRRAAMVTCTAHAVVASKRAALQRWRHTTACGKVAAALRQAADEHCAHQRSAHAFAAWRSVVVKQNDARCQALLRGLQRRRRLATRVFMALKSSWARGKAKRAGCALADKHNVKRLKCLGVQLFRRHVAAVCADRADRACSVGPWRDRRLAAVMMRRWTAWLAGRRVGTANIVRGVRHWQRRVGKAALQSWASVHRAAACLRDAEAGAAEWHVRRQKRAALCWMRTYARSRVAAFGRALTARRHSTVTLLRKCLCAWHVVTFSKMALRHAGAVVARRTAARLTRRTMVLWRQAVEEAHDIRRTAYSMAAHAHLRVQHTAFARWRLGVAWWHAVHDRAAGLNRRLRHRCAVGCLHAWLKAAMRLRQQRHNTQQAARLHRRRLLRRSFRLFVQGVHLQAYGRHLLQLAAEHRQRRTTRAALVQLRSNARARRRELDASMLGALFYKRRAVRKAVELWRCRCQATVDRRQWRTHAFQKLRRVALRMWFTEWRGSVHRAVHTRMQVLRNSLSTWKHWAAVAAFTRRRVLRRVVPAWRHVARQRAHIWSAVRRRQLASQAQCFQAWTLRALRRRQHRAAWHWHERRVCGRWFRNWHGVARAAATQTLLRSVLRTWQQYAAASKRRSHTFGTTLHQRRRSTQVGAWKSIAVLSTLAPSRGTHQKLLLRSWRAVTVQLRAARVASERAVLHWVLRTCRRTFTALAANVTHRRHRRSSQLYARSMHVSRLAARVVRCWRLEVEVGHLGRAVLVRRVLLHWREEVHTRRVGARLLLQWRGNAREQRLLRLWRGQGRSRNAGKGGDDASPASVGVGSPASPRSCVAHTPPRRRWGR